MEVEKIQLIFDNKEQAKSYLSLLRRVRTNELDRPCRRAICYLISLNGITRRHADEIFDFEHDHIAFEWYKREWQNENTMKLSQLVANLYNGACNGEPRDYSPYKLFRCKYAAQMLIAVKIALCEWINE